MAIDSSSTPPLAITAFGRRYSRRRPWAVRDVSFTVPRGSITGLVGPNGAGKSTLIRSCVGFERPDRGRILVEGVDPQRERAKAVASVGYVPQGAALYRSLSIDDHFEIAAAARPGFDRRYAASRVMRIGLDIDRRIGDLSGGEQAQVALAIALGTRAPLLLMDEPLASLDPLARREFLTTLAADVRSRDASVLLSSHIVTDIEQACDRVIVLAAGRLALDTSVTDALRMFRVHRADPPDGDEVVGTFLDPGGSECVLVRGRSGGDPATLEEIVIGHLAAGRRARTP